MVSHLSALLVSHVCFDFSLSFLNYLNSRHASIRFTAEFEDNNQILLLDVLIQSNHNNSFSTSIYRKKTFTGLYTKWDSFTPRKYKINLIHSHTVVSVFAHHLFCYSLVWMMLNIFYYTTIIPRLLLITILIMLLKNTKTDLKNLTQKRNLCCLALFRVTKQSSFATA